MPVEVRDRIDNPPLPTDITLRVSMYSERRVRFSLSGLLASLWVNRRLRQISRGPASAQPLPDYLREDIGLPLNVPTFKQWWDVKWD